MMMTKTMKKKTQHTIKAIDKRDKKQSKNKMTKSLKLSPVNFQAAKFNQAIVLFNLYSNKIRTRTPSKTK